VITRRTFQEAAFGNIFWPLDEQVKVVQNILVAVSSSRQPRPDRFSGRRGQRPWHADLNSSSFLFLPVMGHTIDSIFCFQNIQCPSVDIITVISPPNPNHLYPSNNSIHHGRFRFLSGPRVLRFYAQLRADCLALSTLFLQR